jgi:hypothetical protein
MGSIVEGISFHGRFYRRHLIPLEALQKASDSMGGFTEGI